MKGPTMTQSLLNRTNIFLVVLHYIIIPLKVSEKDWLGV